jgi:hypothetical protein
LKTKNQQETPEIETEKEDIETKTN